MVRIRRPHRSNFHDGHHAAVFVRQDVTMDYIETRVIDEATAHLEESGHYNWLFGYRIQNLITLRICRIDSRGYRKYIPPNQRRREGGGILRRRLRWNALRTASGARRRAYCAARCTTGRRARFPSVWIIRI